LSGIASRGIGENVHAPSKLVEKSQADLPVLGYVSSGSQSHVFGTARWVLVVKRWSIFRALAAFLSAPRWLEEVREKLHGVVAPFAVIDRFRFRGRLPDQEVKNYRGEFAIAKPRFEATQFLNYRIDHGASEQILGYVEEMIQVLEKLHARGFYMFDFIRKNFVFVGERLYISDPGLIVPLRYLWEPTMRVAAAGFGRGLTQDYLNVLAAAKERSENEGIKAEIEKLEIALPGRIKALRNRKIDVNKEDWLSVEFPEDLMENILETVG
jgi:hypothetical protein